MVNERQQGKPKWNVHRLTTSPLQKRELGNRTKMLNDIETETKVGRGRRHMGKYTRALVGRAFD